jgi:hypothetical protein
MDRTTLAPNLETLGMFSPSHDPLGKAVVAAALFVASAGPCLAGGSPGYYQTVIPPVVVYAPPPPPNPLAAIGFGVGNLVGGALAIPGLVLGGLFGAIAPPPAPLCVAPNGYLFPCSAGPGPAYPLPTYEPDSEVQEPLLPPPAAIST